MTPEPLTPSATFTIPEARFGGCIRALYEAMKYADPDTERKIMRAMDILTGDAEPLRSEELETRADSSRLAVTVYENTEFDYNFPPDKRVRGRAA